MIGIDRLAKSGLAFEPQLSLAGNKLGIWWANGDGLTTSASFGMPFIQSGSVAGRSRQATSLLSSVRRLGFVPSTAAVNTPAGLDGSPSVGCRGNTPLVGGFFFACRFGFNSLTSGNRCFVGLSATNICNSGSDPSAATDMVGFGFDAGDALAFYAMMNDASGTATKISTGITAAQETLYEARIYCSPNDSLGIVTMSLTDWPNGVDYSHNFSSDLPTNTTFLTARMKANTGTVATGAAIDGITVHTETEF